VKVQLTLLAIALCLSAAAARAADAPADATPKPIAIAEIKRDTPVDFEKEVLPALTKNCVACHNAKEAEAELVLETPQSILKGGVTGPAVVAGKSGESLLLKVAAHLEEPLMPPADNGVGAVPLTSEQLGLIKLWIDEGAKGEVTARNAELAWQSLPPGMNPIYAVAVTPDGQYAACGRANQIFIYHVASGQLLTRLTDPALIQSGLYKNHGVAHLDLVQSLAFSPDGQTLASGGFREVKLWRRPTNVRGADVVGSTAGVRSLAVSADGKWAATGEATGAIKLWDLATLKDPKTLSGHAAAVTSLGFLPNSGKLVSASEDKTVRLWNVADGAAITQLETPAPILSLAVIADGTQVATGHADNLIRRWTLPADAATPIAHAGDIAGNAGPVVALAVSSADKNQLVSASADGTVRQWNLENNQAIREIKHGAAVTALAVRPDGKQIASAGADNLIKLWNAADGQPWASPDKQPIAEMKGDFRAQFVVAQRERELAAMNVRVADHKKAVADAEVKIISTSAAVTATQTAKESAAKTLKEKQDAVKAPADAKAAADKELVAANEAAKVAAEKSAQAKTAADADAQNADLAKANEAAKTAADAAAAAAKEVEKKTTEATAAANKANQEAMSAEAANTAAEQAAASAVANVKKAVTDVPQTEATLKSSEAQLAKLQAETDAAKAAQVAADKPVRSLAYSADGTQLVSSGENRLVRTWMSDTGVPVDSFEGHQANVFAAAFTPAGILSAADDAGVITWNASPGWMLERTIGSASDAAVFGDRVTALAFNPDGKLLATGGGEPSRAGEVKIFNLADGALARDITDAHSDTVFGLEFSPDGDYLASSAADRFVKVFKAADGKIAKSFEGHTHHVLDVTWKSDGKVLASGGADNVIKVWDFITGDQLRTTAAFEKEITALAFVGATPQVLASSGDKTVRLVNTDDGKMVRTYAGSQDFMYSAATSADGRLAISGGQDSTLFIWLIGDGQLLKSFAAPQPAENPAAQTAGN
jgi:WD40 repeat protein